MSLTYKILWIDDQIEDYIEMGIKSEFETYLDKLGFISTVETFENGNKAKESIKSVKYDLILSDYNIDGDDEQGDSLIKSIRNGGVFTEVLFYSAQQDFETIAKNLYQDRVSFFSLVNDEGFKEFKARTMRLIDSTISKLQELNNIRGLVMSETSALDNSVVDILRTFFLANDGEAKTLRAYIIECLKESASSNFKKAEKLEDLDNEHILLARSFDADKKARTINKLIELKGLGKGDEYSNFYRNYKEEVIDTRNDLAHAKSDTIDGVEYLILTRKGDQHPTKFDQKMCVDIRNKLRKHTSILSNFKRLMLPE